MKNLTSIKNINKYEQQQNNCKSIIPFTKEKYAWFFTGLTQSDGSFAISIIKTN
jgi:hypothetical protein